MKSVGEAMAIGRTFKQAFAKALRSRELDSRPTPPADDDALLALAERAGRRALRPSCSRRSAAASSVDELHRAHAASTRGSCTSSHELARDPEAPFAGERDVQVGRHVRGRVLRRARRTTTRAGSGRGPAGATHEVERGERPSVVILGSGPNRIGQGIEFDYCCVHAAPDRPRAGPRRGDDQLQPRDRLDRLRHLGPPLLRAAHARGRARRLRDREARGRDRAVRRPDAAEAGGRAARRRRADPRHRASTRSTWPRTAGASARCSSGSATRRRRTRPPTRRTRRSRSRRRSAFRCSCARSYVLGGRAMEIVYSVEGLQDYLDRVGVRARHARSTSTASSRTRSRSTSTRCATATTCGSAGSCSTSRRPASTPATRPACCRRTRSARRCSRRSASRRAGIAKALGVVGLLNVQYAIQHEDGLYVIEANPRASRTVPFVSKAIGLPLAKLACRMMLGERIADIDLPADTSTATCASRRRCCRSTASPAPTRCSARRCARPAR